MSTLPEVRGAQPGVDLDLGEAAPPHLPPAWTPNLSAAAARAWGRARPGLRTLRYPLTVYVLSRLLYLVLQVADTLVVPHTSLLTEIAHWDGRWYLILAYDGYPSHVVSNEWSTLGFLPVYSLVLRGAAFVSGVPGAFAGLAVSLCTGAIATVLVGRLAGRWWRDEQVERRAVLFFCLFPGSVVFSMDYTEGLLLSLIAGCMLAIEHRRWVLAGLLAAVATAVGPTAVAIVPALAVAAGIELVRGGLPRRGWPALRAKASRLAAPLLAPVGLLGFGAYLWIHTGTPFASYIAQRDAWGERSDPIALGFTAYHLVVQILGHHTWRHPDINLNLFSGLVGAAFLAWALRYLWRARARVPPIAIVWTLLVALLALTSDQVPPNPRMLLCAFPLLLALAAGLGRTGYRRLIGLSTATLVVMSLLTFVTGALRP